MNETVFRVVVPAGLAAALLAVYLKRRMVGRRTKREAIHASTLRGMDTPAEFAASVLIMATLTIVVDIVLRAVWPLQCETLLTWPAFRDVVGARWAGLAMMFLGLGVYLVGIVGMGESWRIGIDAERPGPLVTTGLFAYVRHPLYSGILIATAGMALLTADVLSMAAFAAAWTTIPIQARLEEEFLVSRYPEYAEYRARTARFIPKFVLRERGRVSAR